MAAKRYSGGCGREEVKRRKLAFHSVAMRLASRPSRLYKHLSWHVWSQTWVVQRKGYKSPGSAPNQTTAAKLACKAWGLTLNELRLRTPGAKELPKARVSKYRFVYWHRRRHCWYAQVRSGYIGRYHTEDAAADALVRKHFAKSRRELLKSVGQPKIEGRARLFKHVYWHVSRRTWVAQVGSRWYGCAKSQAAAANLLIKAGFAKSCKDLQRGPPLGPSQSAGAAAPKSCLRRFLTRQVFQDLWGIYKSHQRVLPNVPGDLQHAMDHAKFILSAKAVPFATFWVLLKYGPAREALEAAVRAAPGEAKSPKAAMRVMQDALCRLSGQPLSSPEWSCWTVNCGRMVSHHSGPHAAAMALGLVDTAPCRGQAKVHLTAKGRAYTLRPLCRNLVKTIQRHMAASTRMAEVTAPVNLSQWRREFAKVTAIVSEALQTRRSNYRVQMVARTWLKTLMAAKGITQLRVGPTTRTEDLWCSFPDAKQHLRHLGHHCEFLQELFDVVGYDGPPELFTMYCCLLNEPSVQAVVRAKQPGWLRHHKAALRRLRSEYLAQSGQCPHPAVLLLSYTGPRPSMPAWPSTCQGQPPTC